MVLLRQFEISLAYDGVGDVGVVHRGQAQGRQGVLGRHSGRLLLHLASPRIQQLAEKQDGLFDRPGGEALRIAQVTQVVRVTEELALQLRVGDGGHRAELVQRPRVAPQTRGKVGQVGGHLLDQQPPHLRAPDDFRRVKLTQKHLKNR